MKGFVASPMERVEDASEQKLREFFAQQSKLLKLLKIPLNTCNVDKGVTYKGYIDAYAALHDFLFKGKCAKITSLKSLQ